FRAVPSALNEKLMGKSPLPVETEPLQLPSTSAASAGVASNRMTSNVTNVFIHVLLSSGLILPQNCELFDNSSRKYSVIHSGRKPCPISFRISVTPSDNSEPTPASPSSRS